MQKLNSIFIGKNHIFHNTMYQKIHIHEKLYNLDAQFCQRIFRCYTTFYHIANTTKSPVPNFAGMSCYCWWGGSKRACQTSSGKGTPCAPAEKSENVVHCKSVDRLIKGYKKERKNTIVLVNKCLTVVPGRTRRLPVLL